MTAMHRLLTATDGDGSTSSSLILKDAEYEAKKQRAMRWLEKNQGELNLACEVTDRLGGSKPNSLASLTKIPRKKSTLHDISDDEDEDWSDEQDDEYPEYSKDNPQVNTAREVHKLVTLFFSSDEEKQSAKQDEMEGCRNALRRARADPVVAPDEPVPLTIRPYNVTPGDLSKDIKYTYRHALTTVFEVKRELAKKTKSEIDFFDLVMCGKKLENHRTLMECGVCARYVVYLRLDERKQEAIGRKESV